MKFHLAYNSDNNYLLPTFISAASALFHSADQQQIVIDVLDCGIVDKEWNLFSGRFLSRFPDVGGLHRHRINTDRIRSLPSWRGSFATYARILTPEILNDCDMCLFVDGDTLFVSDPLELYRVYDAKYWIQGSVDTPCGEERRRLYAGYGLTVPDDYVCCGLMLMNLRALRENGFVEKCLDFLGRYKVLTSVDQEAINCVAHGHISRLDPEWGVFTCLSYANVQCPKCLHYVCGKPWHFTAAWTRYVFDMERAWFDYGRKTFGLTWRDLHPSCRQLWAFAKRRLLTYGMVFLWLLRGDKKWFASYFYKGDWTRCFRFDCPFYDD